MEEAPDYYDVIKQPIDFKIIKKKINSKVYLNVEHLGRDIMLVVSNALTYNPAGSVVAEAASRLSSFAEPLLAEATVRFDELGRSFMVRNAVTQIHQLLLEAGGRFSDVEIRSLLCETTLGLGDAVRAIVSALPKTRLSVALVCDSDPLTSADPAECEEGGNARPS